MHKVPTDRGTDPDVIVPHITHSQSHPGALRHKEGLGEMRDFRFIIPTATFIDTYYMPGAAFSFSRITSALPTMQLGDRRPARKQAQGFATVGQAKV